MATLQELIAQKEALEAEIARTRDKTRSDAIAQVRALMEEHRLTISDLSTRAVPKARAGKGAKVAAKYRDAATGDTWSGRGLQPKWLKAALASGRKLSDFAV
jgi:DNA-binding protein H-NS